MDAGPRSGEVAGIPWLRATLVWMLMMLVETGHGIIRTVFIAPAIGAQRADTLGVCIGSLLVLLIAWMCARWLAVRSTPPQLVVGGSWVLLTLVFEVSLGRALHLTWQQIFSNYNPAHGGYMVLGLAVMFIAPWLVSRWKNGWKT
jgi:hypothetical protein